MAFFGSLIVKLIQWSFVFTKYKYISGTGEFFFCSSIARTMYFMAMNIK